VSREAERSPDERDSAPAPSETDRPGQHRLRSTWGKRLRWFTAEFLVVVAGVLVALALNAWYQDRVDAKREAGYLEQLAADLRQSEAALAEAVSFNESQREKLLELIALFDQEQAPSSESFRELTTLTIAPRQPTLSTAQAIVETGDLQLIADDRLRSAIIQYVGAGESYNETQDAVAWEWLARSIRDYYALVRPGAGPDHPFAVAPDEALSDEALFDAAFDLQLGYQNHTRLQRKMLERVRSVQDHIDRVRAESSSRPGLTSTRW
jgi:hypothetical protein